MRKPTTAALAISSVTLLVMSGCSTSPPGQTSAEQDERGASVEGVVKKYADMSETERTDELVEAAQDEGSLSVYTCSSDTNDKVVPAFEKKYGIEVESFSSGTRPAMHQRISQENSAGGVRADLVECLGPDMELFAGDNVLVPYESPTRDTMPDDVKQDVWTRTYESVESLSWNTDLVKKGDEPASLADLAKPEWKGEVTMVEGAWPWYAGVHRYYTEHGMSDAEFAKLMQQIMENSNALEGHSASTTLMIGGDFKALPQTEQFDILQNRDKGAPISNVPVAPPAVVIPAGMGITSSAENPAAAILFMDFYLTDGQKIMASVYRTPTNPDAVPDLPWRIDDTDDAVEIPMDELDEPDELNAWSVAYDNLLRGNDDVLPD